MPILSSYLILRDRANMIPVFSFPLLLSTWPCASCILEPLLNWFIFKQSNEEKYKGKDGFVQPLSSMNNLGNGTTFYCPPIYVNLLLLKKKIKLLNKQRGTGLENSVDSKVLLCFYSAGTNTTRSPLSHAPNLFINVSGNMTQSAALSRHRQEI